MLTNMTLSAATPASRGSDQARSSSPPRRYRRAERTNRAEGPLSPTVLIYGSAIKTPANSAKFNNMQFSNRRQTGGLAIASSSLPGTFAVADHSLSTLAFRRAGCYFVCANRTCQSSPPNGRERPNETCENRI